MFKINLNSNTYFEKKQTCFKQGNNYNTALKFSDYKDNLSFKAAVKPERKGVIRFLADFGRKLSKIAEPIVLKIQIRKVFKHYGVKFGDVDELFKKLQKTAEEMDFRVFFKHNFNGHRYNEDAAAFLTYCRDKGLNDKYKEFLEYSRHLGSIKGLQLWLYNDGFVADSLEKQAELALITPEKINPDPRLKKITLCRISSFFENLGNKEKAARASEIYNSIVIDEVTKLMDKYGIKGTNLHERVEKLVTDDESQPLENKLIHAGDLDVLASWYNINGNEAKAKKLYNMVFGRVHRLE